MSARTPLWTASSTKSSQALPQEFIDAYLSGVAHEDRRQLGHDEAEIVAAHLDHARTQSGPSQITIHTGTLHSFVYLVQPDSPFLVDTAIDSAAKVGVALNMVIHPIFKVDRDEKDQLQAVYQGPTSDNGEADKDSELAAESWIVLQTVSPLSDEEAENLRSALERSLKALALAVEDSQKMADRATKVAAEIRKAPDWVDSKEESADLVDWMAAGNFVFLGSAEYLLDKPGQDGTMLHVQESTQQGIMRSGRTTASRKLSDAGRAQITNANLLIITKTNAKSSIYRHGYMDFIAVKTFNEDRQVTGETRFIGFWAPNFYSTSVSEVPVARKTAQQVLDRSGLMPGSHSGMNLRVLLETYPRDDMLQMSPDSLELRIHQIMQLNERRRTRVFFRPDVFGRFVSVLVYIPKDRYNSSVRKRIQDVLMDRLHGETFDYQIVLSESSVARLQWRIKINEDRPVNIREEAENIEAEVVTAVRSWREGIRKQAIATFGDEEGMAAAEQWDEAFPPEYRVRFEVEDALEDISRFSSLEGERVSAYVVHPNDEDTTTRLRLYATKPQSLTTLLPVLAEIGLNVTNELPYQVSPTTGEKYYLYDLGIKVPEDVSISSVASLIEQTVTEALAGELESDQFNKLVLYQGVAPEIVGVLRSYGHYLRQLAVPNSLPFMAETLLEYPKVSAGLIAYFQTRFDPEKFGELEAGHTTPSDQRRETLDQIRDTVLEAIDEARTLTADRVLRSFLTVIEATDRTNFYQGHNWLSFKLVPQRISFAPNPRPQHEIWVHSPQVSGVHFRYGTIARGGLRWSDRAEDFRTEVLSLVQTQETKNSVIVPAGAKGGFFAHQLPDPAQDRDAWIEAGKDAYRTFIRGMLDITDNRRDAEDGTVEEWSRDNIIRYDDLDSYLVVAADKGTAGFSDTANEISAEYGHWLGDAFASGGSVGYDHKGMAITARGAWESVKSHFGMLRHDVQKEDFTAVGIGDMSGDVFGNGVLRSKHTRLVAAFNHLHIFIDPNPDAAPSFEERQRLFDLPRSSWADYNADLISEGGGVFDRTARSITITQQMRERFDLDDDVIEMTPNDLIRAVLSAPVDLIYNGGIGTYIKGSEESHDEVGDRANDAIRINGRDIRARVVGEGGNLGATQKGRVEAARNGIRINMDAIDNSGGVSASDIEVNIKILIDQLLEAGKIDPAEREELLLSMTDEVAELILSINVAQNALLRAEASLELNWLPSFMRHITWLENHAGLDREMEAIPTTEELRTRLSEGEGLTTPELAILTAYTKIKLTNDLMDTDIVTDEWFHQYLVDYFPTTLQDKAGELLFHHPLAQNIIAMTVANHIINTGGITVLFRAQEETGADLATLVRGFMVAQRVLRIDEHYEKLQALPVEVDPEVRYRSVRQLRRLLDRSLRWMIHNQRGDLPVAERIDSLAPKVNELSTQLDEILGEREELRDDFHREVEVRREAGFDEELATVSAGVLQSFDLLDIVSLSEDIDTDPRRTMDMYFALQSYFSFLPLLNMVSGLSRASKWDSMARAAMREDMYSLLRDLTRLVLEQRAATPDKPADQVLEDWASDHQRRVERVREFLDDVLAEEAESTIDRTNLGLMTVVLRRLRSLFV